MKLTEQQQEKLRRLLTPQPKFSKPVTWMIRIGLLALLALWIAGGLYLNHQVKQDELRIEQARIEAQRRDAKLRMEAQYQQEMQQRTRKPQTRNIFDRK